MLHAAEQLRDRPDITFVFVGDGAKKTGSSGARRSGAISRNVMFLPFQPREAMDQSCATADVSLISLKRGLAGVIVPEQGVQRARRRDVRAWRPSSRTARSRTSSTAPAAGSWSRPATHPPCGLAVVELAANRDRAAAMGASAAMPRSHSIVPARLRPTTRCCERSRRRAEARLRRGAVGRGTGDLRAALAADRAWRSSSRTAARCCSCRTASGSAARRSAR